MGFKLILRLQWLSIGHDLARLYINRIWDLTTGLSAVSSMGRLRYTARVRVTLIEYVETQERYKLITFLALFLSTKVRSWVTLDNHLGNLYTT